MIMKEEREKVVEYGKKLITSGLAKGTFGNISIYNRDLNLMAISPSGMDYFDTTVEDIVVLTPEGKHVDGQRKPSSEYDMHRIFYLKRPEINAVVHTHSIFATTLSCLNWSIEPLHYLTGYAGSNVPCSKYVQFGTYELAESAFDTMEERFCCLLGNHGLLACGPNIAYAFDVAEQIEFVSELYYRSKVAGNPVILSQKHMSNILDGFKSYGIRT
ncbi:L-fuculose-phosphate aldolase [Alkalibaculum sp. M08DMB]|uniref:L-fuculose-phosphate aldolase n=1 Tax=Alkalibaculum sporogenes TaxID=2655001 RepID=A0A6A7K9I2_9FIRM|nr:L-fuculose-phosphate aldolase [Alkalibaculum sporogenes]MPW26138.1 L-fuculose-phosphate aldolase [Alkalibaculum sporogenes]